MNQLSIDITQFSAGIDLSGIDPLRLGMAFVLLVLLVVVLAENAQENRRMATHHNTPADVGADTWVDRALKRHRPLGVTPERPATLSDAEAHAAVMSCGTGGDRPVEPIIARRRPSVNVTTQTPHPDPLPVILPDPAVTVAICAKCDRPIRIGQPYRRIPAVLTFGRHPGYDVCVHTDCPVR